jgi:Tc5 transposase DNA-binding domain
MSPDSSLGKPRHPEMGHPSYGPLSTSPPMQLHLYNTPPIACTMPSELDQAVYTASKDLSTRKYTSIRAAAAAHGLSRTTLTRRLNEGQSCHTGHESQQVLSSLQENMLMQWILDLERQEHAPTHTQLREIALRISRNSDGSQKIGKN